MIFRYATRSKDFDSIFERVKFFSIKLTDASTEIIFLRPESRRGGNLKYYCQI